MDIEKSISISDNLRVWMLAGKMKQAELAEYLGMVPGMMSYRLMGAKEWRDEDVARISKLMNVSEEKLMQPSVLGETLRRFEKSRKNPSYRKNFGGRLNRLAGKKGKTIRELSAELGMDYSGICKWVMGTGLPSAFVLVKIANYFGMTAAQLAGFEPEAEEPEKAEPEAAKAEPEAAEAEPEEAKPEPEEEKTGKCRTVDERREMFRDRLRELIERSGKTAEETARDTEIGLPLLQGYLEGKYFPGYLMAQKLAEYFGVSTEVLSGEAEMPERNEMPERDEKMASDYQRFAERLSELIRRTGKDAGAVCYEIGIGMADWDGYLRGCWLPSMKIAKRMAKYFGVSLSVLLGSEELPEAVETERATVEVVAESAAAAAVAAAAATSAVAELSSRAREIAEKARGERLTAARAESVAPALAGIIAGMNESSGDQAEILTAALTALHRFIPKRVRHSRKGACCPVCGAEADPACKICEDCGQRLSWELGCGDEVYMRADPECRFWICGKKENGFLYGFDMSFELQEEHPDDLEPTGRRCPELARGLEAAARAEMQEGENERV